MEYPKAKKSLGQNFLHDLDTIGNILDIAKVSAGDEILEIGPGTGALTGPMLLRGAKVFAVEIDSELSARLSKAFGGETEFSLFEGDVLNIDLGKILRKSGFSDGGYKIVANIPYYITAPIIRRLLSLPMRPDRIVLMVQDEVADRLVAPPGSMSLLSLMAQRYADVSKELSVPRSAFSPEPKVDSAVVILLPGKMFSQEEDKRFFALARIGFAARRKTLANNISSGLRIPRTSVEEALSGLGLDIRIRAQELSVSDWDALADRIGPVQEKRNNSATNP
jgi:16S rRNA (adenine1518-N6/adenine1519-N6)-dimethyltransferase